MKQLVAGVLLVVIVGCMISLRSYAADAARDTRVPNGKLAYDTYCTPCHGAAGKPGTAVFTATKKPIDLRTYERRNGGRFPNWQWWDVTFGAQPGNVHTEVWERIRNDQRDAVDRDVVARGVVANIKTYVMSIQQTSK